MPMSAQGVFSHASGGRHTPRSTKAFPPISQNSFAFAAYIVAVPSKVLLKLGFKTTKGLACIVKAL